MIKGSIQEEDITIINIYVPNIGEGNGNPLQCSCLENPRDRGAWWAAIYGVAQSQIQLKWLSSNIGAPQYVRWMLKSMKWEIDSSTIIVLDFNTSLIPIDRSTKQKIRKQTNYKWYNGPFRPNWLSIGQRRQAYTREKRQSL